MKWVLLTHSIGRWLIYIWLHSGWWPETLCHSSFITVPNVILKVIFNLCHVVSQCQHHPEVHFPGYHVAPKHGRQWLQHPNSLTIMFTDYTQSHYNHTNDYLWITIFVQNTFVQCFIGVLTKPVIYSNCCTGFNLDLVPVFATLDLSLPLLTFCLTLFTSFFFYHVYDLSIPIFIKLHLHQTPALYLLYFAPVILCNSIRLK